MCFRNTLIQILELLISIFTDTCLVGGCEYSHHWFYFKTTGSHLPSAAELSLPETFQYVIVRDSIIVQGAFGF